MARLLLSVAAAAVEESHFACLFNCTGSSVCWYDVCIPSPTPPDTPPADDHSVSVGISHKRHLIQSILIAAASFLAFSFLLLLLFYFLRRRRRQLASLHHQHPPPPLHPNAAGDLPDDDDGAPHHVWYIRTVGLDDSVIRSIAATIYKAGDGLIDGGDCSVCLGEFMEGETIKLLPKCTHAFHLSCIDTWLRSHVNCPLCRAPVVAPPPAAASPAEAGGSVPSPENAQIELSQRESQEECVIAIDSASAAAAASSSSGQLDGGEDGVVQPIRRSVSMDSSSLGMLLLRAESESEAEEKLGEEKREIDVGAHKNKGKMVVECLGKQQQQQGVEMKRSLSSRSERLFLSRYGRGRGRGRGRSASVLPL